MGGEKVLATRTYLEMTDPSSLRRGRPPSTSVRVVQRERCEPEFFRYLYATVGADYHWIDRLSWTDRDIEAYVNDPGVSIWLLFEGAALAGYYELRREESGSVEIVYFGLMPGFTGRGLGGTLLTDAVERAWSLGAERVWLHTCSFDHPVAIPNYRARGFTIFRTEEYWAESRDQGSGIGDQGSEIGDQGSRR
jgi:GNAT superfamily N-acetyltransferase